MQKIENENKTFKTWRKQKFSSIDYKNCIYHNCKWIDCEWDGCDFFNVAFFGYMYIPAKHNRCAFRNCTFHGKYIYIQGIFKNCVFENCTFESVGFMSSNFINCVFSGQIIDVNFYGKTAPKDWQTKFKNTDMSKTKLIDVQFLNGLKKGDVNARQITTTNAENGTA